MRDYQRSVGEEGMLFLLDAVTSFCASPDADPDVRDDRYSGEWLDAAIESYDTGFDILLSDGRTATISVEDADEGRREFAELVASRVLRRMIAAGPGGQFQQGSAIVSNADSDEDFIGDVRRCAAAIDTARGTIR